MGFACVVPLLSSLFGACITANTPADLAVTSVQAVDWRDQDEMPGPGASPALGLVRDRDLALARQQVTGGERPHLPLLKIEFTTATNLSKFVIENSYNLGNSAFFCDRPNQYVVLSFPDIYWRGNRLGEHETDLVQNYGGAIGAPVTYYIFINVARAARPQDKPPQEAFDLRKKPEDVCFYVRGGNGSGRGYRSNTVIISKGLIATALQKAPLD